MIIFKETESLRKYLKRLTALGSTVSFVPTMGALHPGHLSLVAAAKQQQGCTVASIFVNPTQFNNAADFAKYPITIDRDIQLLQQAGCNVLLLPSVAEIYPNGTAQTQHYDLGELETLLEGTHRPGHFQGVCQVVHRLLDIVQPDFLFLGRKDYQQCMVLTRLVAITHKNIAVHIIPTLREKDGLAMSSRNMRLNATERQQALSIYRQLTMIKAGITHTNLPILKAKAAENLLADGFTKIDYVSVADAETLREVAHYDPEVKTIVLIAAFLNEIRLIDNMDV